MVDHTFLLFCLFPVAAIVGFCLFLHVMEGRPFDD